MHNIVDNTINKASSVNNADSELTHKILRCLAHDLNNMLTITMGNVSLCQLYLDGISEKLETVINNSLNSCKKAQELIQKLHIVSELHSQAKETVSVIDLVKDSIAYLGNQNAVKIELINRSESYYTDVNPGQLRVVFQNLIQNALQAIDENGSIKIIVENIKFKKEDCHPNDSGCGIKISFIDDGVGISSEIRGNIFNNKISTKENCSGLGLMICKLLTERNGGFIHFTSEPEKGSTFIVNLKCNSPDRYTEKSSVLEFHRKYPD